MDRLTVDLARCASTMFQTSFPEQTLGPAALAPNRNVTFPAAGQHQLEGPDLSQRARLRPVRHRQDGAQGQRSTSTCSARRSTASAAIPTRRSLATARSAPTRTWTDIEPRLRPGVRPGEPDRQRRVRRRSTTSASAPRSRRSSSTRICITGFNHRQTQLGVLDRASQHELVPRVAVDVGYFRRIWANFRVTDNLALDAGRLHAIRHRQSRSTRGWVPTAARRSRASSTWSRPSSAR